MHTDSHTDPATAAALRLEAEQRKAAKGRETAGDLTREDIYAGRIAPWDVRGVLRAYEGYLRDVGSEDEE